MKEIMMKAKAGVTLVELLVVILIVTILSVSLLPLLKPYIEEAKFAAEPIPVLANLQTKINLYHYEKDNLPGTADDDGGYTWLANTNRADGVVTYDLATLTYANGIATTNLDNKVDFAKRIDVDWQDLLGKRMLPSHFTYHLIKGDGASKYGYAFGVFGDGNGLGKGTGYAVLTIVDTDNKTKIVGTWSRYKPVSDAQIRFATTGQVNDEDEYCYLPQKTDAFADDKSTLISTLTSAGWEFTNGPEQN
jgi:prepilin-type N-terminal cleavage/methylation domain-containing protein